MSELSALITGRFNEISLAQCGKDYPEDMQLDNVHKRSPARSLDMGNIAVQQQHRVLDGLAEGLVNKPGVPNEQQHRVSDESVAAQLVWYPAPEFLQLEAHKSYSFVIADICVDSVTTDGQQFAQIVNTLTAQLEQHMATARLLVSVNEKIHKFDLEVEELLRVAIGRTQLLISKRIKQFREQLYRHLNPIPYQKVTKLNDLHGLWALIDMQLDDIRTCFDQVEQYRLRNWTATDCEPASAVAEPNVANFDD